MYIYICKLCSPDYFDFVSRTTVTSRDVDDYREAPEAARMLASRLSLRWLIRGVEIKSKIHREESATAFVFPANIHGENLIIKLVKFCKREAH